MFQTKPTNTAIVIVKNHKLNNVLINVVDVVMTRSQVLEQHIFREREPMKAKIVIN
jgi:hypothetical protein